jgi:diguanylate cyclase (GGDEF)-like protein
MNKPDEPDLAHEAEARYCDLALACDQAVLLCAEGRIAFANATAVGLLGATQSAQILGREIELFLPQRKPDADGPPGPEQPQHVQIPLTRLDGSTITVSLAWMPCRYGGREAAQIVIRDIAGRRSLERQVQFLTRHDILTEMPNRTDFRDRLIGAMARAKRNGRQVAVMLLNLDRFKALNGKIGHDNADLVLQNIAARLKGSIRKADAAARVGGDEFALILEGLEQREQAAVVANRVLTNLKAPIEIGGTTVEMTASAGIAASPADADDLDALLRMTDVAMYAAKGEGGNGFRFYFAELEAMSHRDQLRREQTAQRIATLTEREREVMDVLVEGNSNKAIAYLLGISQRTIESHRARVMAKMEADSLPDLVRMILELKL